MGKTKGNKEIVGGKEFAVHTTWKNSFKRDWQLYLMLLFPIVMVILFNYASYPGMRMIFMVTSPRKDTQAASGLAWRRSSKYLRMRIFIVP